MSLYSEYYLAHYGVKGMKWGVRKAEKARSKAMYDLSFQDAMYASKIKTATRDRDKYKAKDNQKEVDRIERTMKRYEHSRKVLNETMTKIGKLDISSIKSKDITRLGRDTISKLTNAELAANRRGEYGAWAGDIRTALREKERIQASLSKSK